MTADVKSSWQQMYNEHTFSNDSVLSCVNNYEQFAKTYDEASSNLGFSLPEFVGDVLQQEVARELLVNSESSLLDVAAGTGLIADKLRSHGFTGMIDGVDGSQKMMVKAEEKGQYRSLTQHILMPGCPLLMNDNTYDILTCVAALSTGHIQCEMLSDMLRVVKRGGHVIFTVRDNETAVEYVTELKRKVRQMSDQGQWRQVSMKRATQYAVNYAPGDGAAGESGPMYSLVYHFVKL